MAFYGRIGKNDATGAGEWVIDQVGRSQMPFGLDPTTRLR
jgi:hypothetical protein